MMIVLLLLSAFVCQGLSFDKDQVLDHGQAFFFRIRGTAHSIEFTPKHSSKVTILWKKGDSLLSRDGQRFMMGSYFQINRVTPENSGRYVARDENDKELSVYTLVVRAMTRTYQRKPGSSLRFLHNLESNLCNIYFFPKNSIQPGVLKEDVIRQGKLQRGLDLLECDEYDMEKPCGLSLKGLRMSSSGHYEIRDQNDNTILVVSLEMEEIKLNFKRKIDEKLEFTVNLPPHACNIYFYRDDRLTDRVDMVRKGRLLEDAIEDKCIGFELLRSCGIRNLMLQTSCRGRYVIKDQNDNTALEVHLEMEEPASDEPSYIGIGVSAFLISLCCGCIKRCCCGKSSSSEDKAETPADDPEIQEYDQEPVRPGGDHSQSETSYPAQPSSAATAPLIHAYPTENLPPAYSEIYDYPSVILPPPYSEALAPSEQAEAPTFPVQADAGPQFEVRGVTFPSAPLSSESASCEVYSSDKFNFKHL